MYNQCPINKVRPEILLKILCLTIQKALWDLAEPRLIILDINDEYNTECNITQIHKWFLLLDYVTILLFMQYF